MSDGMKPVRFIHGTNTSQADVRRNVEHALAHANVRDYWDRRCVIVGGGPSLDKHKEDVRNAVRGGNVYALNGAVAWIMGNCRIAPEYVVMMDARPENADFVKVLPHTEWLIASQCHPDVFKALEDLDQEVIMWHAAGSEVVTEKGLRGIAGGGTVLSRAINIAIDMGYRHITLAGVDSSYDGDEHHAYRQPMNDDDKRIRVATPAGTEFVTTPELAEQADTVMNQMLSLQNVMGVAFQIIGDGLLPSLYREYRSTIREAD